MQCVLDERLATYLYDIDTNFIQKLTLLKVSDLEPPPYGCKFVYVFILQLRDHGEPEGSFSIDGYLHSEPVLIHAQRDHLGLQVPTCR